MRFHESLPAIHSIKVPKKYFLPLWVGIKPFLLVQQDKNYEVGDFVCAIHYDAELCKMDMEKTVIARITYILCDAEAHGLKEGHTILGLKFKKDFTSWEKLLITSVNILDTFVKIVAIIPAVVNENNKPPQPNENTK